MSNIHEPQIDPTELADRLNEAGKEGYASVLEELGLTENEAVMILASGLPTSIPLGTAQAVFISPEGVFLLTTDIFLEFDTNQLEDE